MARLAGARRAAPTRLRGRRGVPAQYLHDGEAAMKIAILPGDGIGPEIVGEATKVLDVLRA